MGDVLNSYGRETYRNYYRTFDAWKNSEGECWKYCWKLKAEELLCDID